MVVHSTRRRPGTGRGVPYVSSGLSGQVTADAEPWRPTQTPWRPTQTPFAQVMATGAPPEQLRRDHYLRKAACPPPTYGAAPSGGTGSVHEEGVHGYGGRRG